ncbi:MAG: helix-turn-helix domain-containing protein [Lutibacter sp.]
MKKTQNEMLDNWLRKGRKINQGQALKMFGVGRLASRINELSKTHNIGRARKRIKTRFHGLTTIMEYFYI